MYIVLIYTAYNYPYSTACSIIRVTLYMYIGLKLLAESRGSHLIVWKAFSFGKVKLFPNFTRYS